MAAIRRTCVVAVGSVSAVVIDFGLLPWDHPAFSLGLIPVLFACRVWRPRAVAVTALAAMMLYVAGVQAEHWPLAVWPFGMLGLVIGGYLTVQVALKREAIARPVLREREERQRLQVFMGMVAHELAGALTNIALGSEMLGQRRRDDSANEESVALSAIDAGTAQARRLLADLRDAATIGAGTFRVEPAEMDLTVVAREIVEQQQACTPDHRIVLDAPECAVDAWDRDRIAQLLVNLVSNACKYSPSGSEVVVVVRRSSVETLISVRDHGIGIESALLDRIFEPFARANGNNGTPGTGLGLWISKAIAESHGGRIWVESEYGKGSIFTVSLPSSPAANDPIDLPRLSASVPTRPDRATRTRRPAPRQLRHAAA